jgi:hypothetical protein
MLLDGNAGVRRRDHTTDRFYNVHMGYGAASHMSAVSEPAEVWWKACGTPENLASCRTALPTKLRHAGARGQITPELIFESTIFPWCNPTNPAVHVQELSPEARQIVLETVPWVVRNNPQYFPFSNPKGTLSTTGLFAKCATERWAAECYASSPGIIST